LHLAASGIHDVDGIRHFGSHIHGFTIGAKQDTFRLFAHFHRFHAGNLGIVIRFAIFVIIFFFSIAVISLVVFGLAAFTRWSRFRNAQVGLVAALGKIFVQIEDAECAIIFKRDL
jgi:hypothetical protein